MKTTLCLLTALCLAAPIYAAEKPAKQAAPRSGPVANPQIDFNAHLELMRKTQVIRTDRRLTEDRFTELAAEPGTVVLDARSADKYKLRHIKGAISLPFTDFTAESLAKVIPTKETRVLIYCNNNFRGDRLALEGKSVLVSLNISTFGNLTAYGYTNVWELGPNLDVKGTKLPFEGTDLRGDAEREKQLRPEGGFSNPGSGPKLNP